MTQTRTQTGIGSLAKLNPIKATSQNTIASAISALYAAFNSLIDAYNGRVSLGDATSFSHAGNLDAVDVEWITPDVPNTEFAIPHLLGRIPVRFEFGRKTEYCDIKDSGTAWTKTHVYLKCNTATVLVLLRIS